MTAQLDHLLLGPTGIYVIEARNWSQAFLESGDRTDPIKQVKRGSHLCRHILDEAGCTHSVRSIVACAGAMPDQLTGEHVAVMPVTRLFPYVQHGVPQLSPEDVTRIRHILT